MPGLPKRHGRRYPWDRWFRAPGYFRLIKGTDYDILNDSMIKYVRYAAKKRGIPVSVVQSPDGSSILVTKTREV